MSRAVTSARTAAVEDAQGLAVGVAPVERADADSGVGCDGSHRDLSGQPATWLRRAAIES